MWDCLKYQRELDPSIRIGVAFRFEKDNIFHVSQLQKYIPDPNHIITYPPLYLQEDLSYMEESIQILDHKVKQLRTQAIPLVKVLWRRQQVEEVTWEPKEEM